MTVVHILAVFALLPQFWSMGSILSLLVLYWVTACLGVTLGYHRLLSHRSFKVPKWLERFFATCGSLSAEFGPIQWVGIHRQHHRYSDTDRDPHNIYKGFWWSHILWMFFKCPSEKNVPVYSKDISNDPYYVWLDKYFLILQVPLGLVLYLMGGWSFVLWGIFLRLAIVYQVTWLVNSAAHTWGKQPHPSNDNSRNSLWVALLTFGEGWHNNHHAFPSSAKHGMGGYQLDITWIHIIILERLGLATKIKLS